MVTILERMAEFSELSSWAIWESSSENKVFEKESDMNPNIDFSNYTEQLQKTNIVFVAMNPGGTFSEEEAKNATRKVDEPKEKWLSFHTRGRSRDYLLAHAIMGTKAEGSYITDFYPIRGSKSEKVIDFVDKPENNDLKKELIKEFDEEITKLFKGKEVDEVNLICIGKDTYNWAVDNLVNGNFKNVYKAFRINHYSSENRWLGKYAKEMGKSVSEYYSKEVEEVLKKISWCNWFTGEAFQKLSSTLMITFAEKLPATGDYASTGGAAK